MRERRSASGEHDDERSARDRQPVQPPDARQLASQMGNAAFTALVARQSDSDEIVRFPEDHIGPEHGSESDSDEIVRFPEDHIGPEYGSESDSDEIVEFPEDHIGPNGS